MPAEPAVAYGKKHPFNAPLKERILLNGTGSAKETFHYEIGLEGSGLDYLPGDALAVIPSNPPEMVDLILQATRLAADAEVDNGKGATVTLREALIHHYDITAASSAFLRKYNTLAEHRDLTALMAPDQKEELRGFLYGRQIIDIVEAFYDKPFGAADFVSTLRKMPPRLYSIASSLKAHPDEVHLTVASVRYNTHGRNRVGVASTYLAERIEIGETLPIYMHHNKNFRLPEDPDTPVIMVGPGTGIAPFRAFLQEREALAAKGKNWLFFGDQHYLTDFLYQLELQNWYRSGLLTRLDVAFSRDQKQKVYVQHQMLKQADALWGWLQQGAHFYVCGDANRMAGDVHQALVQIAQKVGGLDAEAAESYYKDLKKQKRYQRDVY